jgi:hypothetical protein
LEPDAAVATELLDDALSLADEQGAVPTALRAAALLVLRTKGDADRVACARATLDMLDGRAARPTECGWMSQRSAALRNGLNSGDRPAVQA